MVAAFPVAKLAYLGIRQLSKPLANFIRDRARASPFFKKYVCMPPAQLHHWYETRLKMRELGLKSKSVAKLSDIDAVDTGATILGETIIYIVSALTIFAEYRRQANKEQAKEELASDKMTDLEKSVQDLKQLVTEQRDQCEQLQLLLKSGKK
ncbi:hypothetical protein BOX15_Mlig033007g1 [Macrostomum lignano]|uniref:OPA3-like protein n=1 Tax=Macrostomum lignano TaxID=282301 RepID=A0A267EJQ8_9PLAT|nr:hypothetical protein BOX15_Mlig032783g1 [Macrostomum lignano]PAA76316.1 hypothetical protein BOX15_Mlig032508g2 [Macrostomum lignano]PAA87020.1 hypothetical protein BOX15_Mlig033007g1 [Macrostomum lignano]